MTARFQQAGSARREVFSLKIPDSDEPEENSEQVDADAAINMLADSLFATLQMFAYRENWFRDGKLIVPRPVSISDDLIFKSGSNTLLASTWMALENADEHLRYFGKCLIKEPFHTTDDNGANRFITKFDLDLRCKLHELIAHHRFSQLCLGFALETHHIGEELVGPKRSAPPLPPDGFISKDEVLAYKLLRDVYHLPITLVQNSF